MRWCGEVQGVLGVGRRTDRGVHQEDADLLEAYAGPRLARARNARAFERSSRQARIQRGFFRIAAVLGQSLSLARDVEAVAQAAERGARRQRSPRC